MRHRICRTAGIPTIAVRGAALVGALLLLITLAPASTHGAANYKLDGTVSKIRVVYTGACQPGDLHTNDSIPADLPIGGANQRIVRITGPGDIFGCLAVTQAPGTILIDSELFKYSTISAMTLSAIDASATSVVIINLPGQTEAPADFPESGQAYIGSELVSFTRAPGSSKLTLTSRPSPTPHAANSLVRVQGQLRLLERAQPTYIRPPELDPDPDLNTIAALHNGSEVRSPKTYLTCRARLKQTAQVGPDEVFSRSRCYDILEPGRPGTTFWPDNPIDPIMPIAPLYETFFHDWSSGTINDADPNPTTVMTLQTNYLGVSCFAFIDGLLWGKTTSSTTVDQIPFDEDFGTFRISLYADAACALPPVIQLGTLDVINGSVPAGTNLSATEISQTLDSDGDGCSDFEELSDNPNDGGLRDPFNKWDYFDPDGNGRVRVSDITAVVNMFNVDDDEPGYTTATDRTLSGPSNWNTGPPDGRHRVSDIVLVVAAFNHDCV